MQSAQFHLNFDLELTHWWFVARRRILRTLIALVLPPDPRSLVIDVGCATGGNIGALSADYRCLGIDRSPEAIELARRRFPHVEFVCGEAPQDLNGRVHVAKLFLMTDVLEHVEHDVEVFRGLWAAAAPGTHFLLTVPADQSLWSPHDVSHGHYRRYDVPRFERLWQGLSATPLLLSHFNSRLYPVIKAIRAMNRLRGKASGQADTDVAVPAPAINRVLEGIFFGECRRLEGLLGGKPLRPYRRGVSLIAILRKEAVLATPHLRPSLRPAVSSSPAIADPA